jgi:hypothetical protein
VNRAYVHVPWVGGQEVDPASFGQQRNYFLNIEHDVTPTTPIVDNYNPSNDTFVVNN